MNMITIIPSGRNDLMEVEVTGDYTKDDMKEFEKAFHEKKTPNEDMNLLLVVNDMDFSMKALKEDFLFGKDHMHEFNKVAVVSDKKLLEMGAKIEDMMPNLEVKHFDKDHHTDAVTWIQ
ncbi:STAS/SEC14 domain-containing protein [Rossellomorea vietnamensis]|uniref:STAS/SEC14 domain-containing protein n=2 Tax=Bacillales TaxID=1385 RepID=A0A5D4MK78_9BACI|nr:STAS/SEC14 domain-containing protein [Rossellomorea vietnamensis]